MNGLKRIKATVFGYFEQAVSSIENHEALSDAALLEIQRASTKAQSHLRRVQSDGEQLKRDAAKAAEDGTLWTTRALRCAETDRDKALECVRRKNECLKDHARLNALILDQEQLEQNLSKDLKELSRKVEELKRRKNSLKLQECAAKAQGVVGELDGSPLTDLEDIFSRWELRIAEHRINYGRTKTHTEPLESEFLREEEEAALQAELTHLMDESIKN